MPRNFLETYAQEVSEHLDYLVNWPINNAVQLGDIGVISNGIFKRLSTLETKGIGVPKQRDGQGSSSLEYASRDGVQWTVDLGAESQIKGLGGKVNIDFSREGAVFLRIGDYTVKQFDVIDGLGKEIQERYKNGDWERGWIVVTEVVTASAATILVSGSNSAKASIQLDASLPATDAIGKGKFSQVLGLTGSFAAQLVGESVSPLLRTSGLRRRLIGNTFRGSGIESTTASLFFGKITSSEQLIDN
jgi:hypothetical protein